MKTFLVWSISILAILLCILELSSCILTPGPTITDGGMATCDDAIANAGHCSELVAEGADEDSGTEDDIPFEEWCGNSHFLDLYCIANATDCVAAGACLEN
jgi:hypothetical protein